MRVALVAFLLSLSGYSLAQTQRNVSFSNGTIRLAGTLTFPLGTSIHPAIIIVLGSGATNREGEVDGLKPFQEVAAELAKKGFIVLRYDNRSKGHSQGKPIEEATTTELATDAQAAFTFLKGLKQVDPQRIGLIGHSEGATIAAVAASKIRDIKGLLTLNAPALPGFEDILLTTEQRLRKAGTPDDTIRSYLANLKRYLGHPANASLPKRKLAARTMVLFEIAQLPVQQQAKITKADIESAVNNQMHEVLTRWEQHYLSLNPAVYYPKVSVPIHLLFSESEVKGLLAKRLRVFNKVFHESKQAHSIRLIKHADHNLFTTNQKHKAVSLTFLKAVVEEAIKSI